MKYFNCYNSRRSESLDIKKQKLHQNSDCDIDNTLSVFWVLIYLWFIDVNDKVGRVLQSDVFKVHKKLTKNLNFW